MNIAFTKKSSNAKVGAIPVTTSSKASCPLECPLLENGCYASAGFHTRLHWDKVTSGERGAPLDDVCEKVASLKPATIWRHNIAGDLIPNSSGLIDQDSLEQLTTANTGRRGFTYTHYNPVNTENQAAIRAANDNGFTVNISANNPIEAETLRAKLDLPTVSVVPSDFWAGGDKVGNIVRCPAETRDTVTCKTCKLCSVSDRSVIVGFTVHGTQSKKADIIASAAGDDS